MATSEADSEVLRRLANIEKHVDSIDETSAFAMRAHRDEHLWQIREIFGISKRRAQVYVAVSGDMIVNEIAEHLAMKPQNVTAELTLLEREGLLRSEIRPSGTYYTKKPIDRALRVSEFLRNEFGLERDGTESSND